MTLQNFERLGAEVGAGVDAERLHPARRRRADAVEFADRQGGDERRRRVPAG